MKSALRLLGGGFGAVLLGASLLYGGLLFDLLGATCFLLILGGAVCVIAGLEGVMLSLQDTRRRAREVAAGGMWRDEKLRPKPDVWYEPVKTADGTRLGRIVYREE